MLFGQPNIFGYSASMAPLAHLQVGQVTLADDSAKLLAALELIVSALPTEERAAQLAALHSELAGANSHLAIVLAAKCGERLVGAVFAQIVPGKTAGVWPPQLVRDENEATATELLAALERRLAKSGVCLAQSLLASDAALASERLTAAGYRHAAELLYLVSEAEQFPDHPPRLPFEVDPFRSEESERLVRLIQATYEDTLDCPLLDGLRDTADVLAGYRAVGKYRPELWQIVRQGGRDVGCLLLADHPQHSQWELVYMGLVPTVRGRGWGIELTRHAQWLAREAKCARILLGVDAANQPAIRIYGTCGFRACDHRRVMVKSLQPNADAP